MGLFEEYKNHPDKDVRDRANNWGAAIGLQDVDGLRVSDFLIQLVDSRLRARLRWRKLHKSSMSITRIENFIVQLMRLSPPNLEMSKQIKEENKLRRPGMYK